jgi:hypothetical protein
MAPIPDWRRLVDHVMAVPERIYERWTSSEGWDNHTVFGTQFGEDGVSWCVIFDWDMYADVDLKAIVPKVDNVSVFSDWARKRGQWSEYPSVGAWVNLSDGGHTEIVIGWNADYVFTKGGNTIPTGAADSGQGNGVFRHDNPGTPRRSARVVGYFAPRFPDGICPPTADPADPRGGRAVAAWRWPGPAAPTTPHTEIPEDDMALSADDKAWLVAQMRGMLSADVIPAPTADKANPTWALSTYLRLLYVRAQETAAQQGAINAVLAALAKGGGLTPEQATAAAEAGARAALAELGHALGA